MAEQLKKSPSTNGRHYSERRSEERIPFNATAMVETANGESQRYTAQIVEVSESGMKMKVRHGFDEGSMVRLDLPCNELGPVTTVLACVMHNRHEGDGLWTLGCRFCTDLDDDDLKSLGIKRNLIASPNRDNRTYDRFPARAQVLYRNMASSTEPVYSGSVLNASPGGIGMLVKEALAPGTLLDLTVQGDRGQKLFEILACVVYRHNNGDGEYTVGCNFIRELNEEELGTLN